MLGGLELGTNASMYIWNASHGYLQASEADIKEKARRDQHQIDFENFVRRPGTDVSAYRYAGLLGYLVRPYQSATINTDSRGFRLNGAMDAAVLDSDPIQIWMFGSSALFGLGQRDEETVAAVLETLLNTDNPDRSFQVRNFGVAGFTSIQDRLNLNFQLLYDTPDLVITFNGINDHYLAWQFDDVEHAVLWPGVNAGLTLEYYWQFHENRRIVDWRRVKDLVRWPLPNTAEFIDRVEWQVKRYLWSRSDVGAWKAQYRERRDAHTELVRESLAAVMRALSNNAEQMVATARMVGANTILVQQPFLLSSAKTPVNQEIAELQTQRAKFFALPDQEIEPIVTLDPVETTRSRYWDQSIFVAAYAEQNRALGEIAQRLGAGYVDMQNSVDQSGELQVFVSLMHFTAGRRAIHCRTPAPGSRAPTRARF